MPDELDGARDETFSALDVTIVEGIRKGLRDDEIAVAGHRSEAWVSARISYLCESLGLEGRYALGAWQPGVTRDATEPPAIPADPEAEGSQIGRRLILAGALASVVGLATGALWLRSGGDGTRKADKPEPTNPIRTPLVTATPSADRLLNEGIEDASGEFATVAFGPGDPIEETQGFYFMDVGTGGVTGFSVQTELIGLPPGTFFSSVSPDHGYAVVDYRGAQRRQWVVERSSRRAFGWWSRALSVATSSSVGKRFVLEETSGPQGDLHSGRFHVVEFGKTKIERVGAFSVPVAYSLNQGPLIVSPDGAWVAGWLNVPGPMKVLYQFEVATGRSVRITDDRKPAGEPDFVTRPPEFDGTRGFVAYIDQYNDTDARRIGKRSKVTKLAIAWGDAGVRETTNPPADLASAFVSPDGKLAVWDTPVRRVLAQQTLGVAESWPGITVGDPATAAPKYFIRSAALQLATTYPWSNPWLADSSGFVARVAEEQPFSGLADWEQIGLAIVSADGSRIERLPHPPGSSSPWGSRSQNFGPMPSPIDPDLLSYGGRKVFNRRTRTWVEANVTRGNYFATPPWGSQGAETAFALPQTTIGDGGLGQPLLLAPKVDREKPSVATAIAVLRATALRPSLAEGAAATATLPPGVSLVVSDLAPGVLEQERLALGYLNRQSWIHVRTEGGASGWVTARDVGWA